MNQNGVKIQIKESMYIIIIIIIIISSSSSSSSINIKIIQLFISHVNTQVH